ncbi:MAG: Uma2 family endonuclease [Isosphaeraceae bacterium]|nr:Uma2 family endonuclease [Isosphaeraceae bacterium]
MLTAEEFGRRPDPGYPEELVRGRIVAMPSPKPRHGEVCGRQVVYLLRRFLEDNDLGRMLSNDAGIITERDPDTVRGAEVAFYSYARLSKGPWPDRYPDVAPELVVEVRSPNDRWRDLYTKITGTSRPGSWSSWCSTPMPRRPTSSMPTGRRAPWGRARSWASPNRSAPSGSWSAGSLSRHLRAAPARGSTRARPRSPGGWLSPSLPKYGPRASSPKFYGFAPRLTGSVRRAVRRPGSLAIRIAERERPPDPSPRRSRWPRGARHAPPQRPRARAQRGAERTQYEGRNSRRTGSLARSYSRPTSMGSRRPPGALKAPLRRPGSVPERSLRRPLEPREPATRRTAAGRARGAKTNPTAHQKRDEPHGQRRGAPRRRANPI